MAGATVLFDTIREFCPKVKDLGLDASNLDVGCMNSLGDLIQQSDSLEILGLYGNESSERGINDECIEILSSFIVGNQTLESLDLHGNKGITKNSVQLFEEMAAKSCLKGIVLYSTLIDDADKKKIKKQVEIPNDQRELPIQSKTKSAAKIAYEDSSSTAVSAST